MKFEDLFDNDDLLDALYDMRFDETTPIQEKSIPVVLQGYDLLGVAQTGTGKTAAYLLPVIDKLISGDYPANNVNCVIMVPTRELAQQIDRMLQGFSYYLPVTGMAIYGGTDGDTYDTQKKGLRAGSDIIIATPGRLLSHINMGYVDLSKVSFFVLDEADRMLDMGFYDDIMKITSKLPTDRQTLLFSATMPSKIKEMAKLIMHDPKEVKLSVSRPADKIKQEAYMCYENQKLPILKEIFQHDAPNRVIIFASSKQKVKDLTREFKKWKINVAEMHSDLEQKERDEVMLRFKAGNVNVVVATDIISRGIDIDNIETVINYDVPAEAEDYVHRVGRTARADRDGRAITLISDKDRNRFRKIERLIRKEVQKKGVNPSLGETPDYSSHSNKKTGREKGQRVAVKEMKNIEIDDNLKIYRQKKKRKYKKSKPSQEGSDRTST